MVRQTDRRVEALITFLKEIVSFYQMLAMNQRFTLALFLGAKSTSIRDCVRRSVGRSVGQSVPTMKVCEICLHGKLVTSRLLREEEKEEEIS